MSEMCLVRRILSRACGQDELFSGQFVNVPVDLAFGNDITAPIAIREFHEWGGKEVFDKNKVALVADHFTPAKDIQSAEQVRQLRTFAKEQGLSHFYEGAAGGIEPALLPDLGLIVPGDVVIGADSHSCTHGALGAFATGVGSTDLAAAMLTGEVWFRVPETIQFVFSGERPDWITGKDLILNVIGRIGVSGALYKAMEFVGETISRLPMEDRFTMSNMAIEAGAKAGVVPADDITAAYLKGRTHRSWRKQKRSSEQSVESVIEIDVSEMRPQVACPPSPGHVQPVDELGSVAVDQVVLGSCTNGRFSDLALAASILRGRKVSPKVRLIVIPATQEIYADCLREGLLELFVDVGGVVGPPTCGPCLGGHMGVLASGEVALSTTNRNFVGRMGHLESQVYLASPAVAAATAIKGTITAPDRL